MEKKTKYDTNPLDPDFVRGTEDMGGSATRDINRTPNERAREDENAEAPTRRYDNPVMPASYPSVFVPPVYPPPAPVQRATPPPTHPPVPPHAMPHGRVAPPTSRTIPKLGLPENVAMILPYLPFPVVGGVAGAVELFLVPRNEGRVRFHAAQGLALHLLVMAVGFLFKTGSSVVDGGVFSVLLGIASVLFSIAAFVFFIVSIIRVWKGEDHRIEPLMEATKWLNEKIDPKK
jgi:uncharacterized membrane protein